MLDQVDIERPQTEQNALRTSAGALPAAPVQAIILAAGRGSRLKSETRNRPKCLAEVDNLPLLEHQLRCLSQIGVQSVFVVAGYRANQVEKAVEGRAAVIRNGDWAASNSLYSLWLCRHWVAGPVIVLNCDVLAHPEILHRLVGSGANSFAYDSSSGTEDEHMKVRMEDGYLEAMSKCMEPEHSHGENVGILYFDRDAVEVLFWEAEAVLASHGRHVWAASAVERVARGVKFLGVDVSDLPWCEIDFPEDLAHARQNTWPIISGQRPKPCAPMRPAGATMSGQPSA